MPIRICTWPLRNRSFSSVLVSGVQVAGGGVVQLAAAPGVAADALVAGRGEPAADVVHGVGVLGEHHDGGVGEERLRQVGDELGGLAVLAGAVGQVVDEVLQFVDLGVEQLQGGVEVVEVEHGVVLDGAGVVVGEHQRQVAALLQGG